MYFKTRSRSELEHVLNYLKRLDDVEYVVFSYDQKYRETDYLDYLRLKCDLCIVIGRHESQGFAIQEAMSCDVALLVWSVTSMSQEVGATYPEIQATTVSYWSDKCGEIFYRVDEFEPTFKKIMKNIDNDLYRPREYVVRHLSVDALSEKFMELFQ